MLGIIRHIKKINGIIKSYTISRTSTDRYYISILYETADKVSLNNGKSVGIDLGIKEILNNEDLAKITIIGVGVANKPGVAATMFEGLYEANINIHMIKNLSVCGKRKTPHAMCGVYYLFKG